MQPDLRKITNVITILQIFLITLATLVLAGACSSREDRTEGNKKISIVTTTGMIKDAVENIAGEHAEVVALMGPGVDPHLYKATQGDLQKLTDADVIFYNGLHLEGKMGEVLEKLGRARPVIAVSSEIPENLLRTVPGFQGAHDPHIWFNAGLWKNAVSSISRFMQEYDSANADHYNQRADKYLLQLDSLHQAVKTSIAQIPEEQRALITAHDAFG